MCCTPVHTVLTPWYAVPQAGDAAVTVPCTTQLPSHADTKPENLQMLLLGGTCSLGGVCCLLLTPLWLSVFFGGPAMQQPPCAPLVFCCHPTLSASAARLSHLPCTLLLQRRQLASDLASSGGQGWWHTPHLSSTWGISRASRSMPAGLPGSSLSSRSSPSASMLRAGCCYPARLCVSLPPASAAAHQLLLLRPQDVSVCTCRGCQTAASAGPSCVHLRETQPLLCATLPAAARIWLLSEYRDVNIACKMFSAES